MIQIKDEIFYSQQDPDTLVIIDAIENDNHYFKLTGLSHKIFLCLKNKGDLEAFIQTTLQEYDVTEEKLRSDIQALIDYLINNGIAKGS